MNKTEAAYALILEARKRDGEIQDYLYEKVKLRLADNTFYTPDFFVLDKDGYVEFVEVKGFLRDDALVKYKVAAEQYPWARWKMVRKSGSAFEVLYES